MKKDAYKLEGSVLDVLFNYVSQEQPIPRIVLTKALKQWQNYLAAEGDLSLEASFFGSQRASYASRSASYKSERKLYMALLNLEVQNSTDQELEEYIQKWGEANNPLIDHPKILSEYLKWKKAINAGRILTQQH